MSHPEFFWNLKCSYCLFKSGSAEGSCPLSGIGVSPKYLFFLLRRLRRRKKREEWGTAPYPRQGAQPHKRELKGLEPPKRVMRSWPDPRPQAWSQEPQANERPEYKDEVSCDAHCTKNVASVVKTAESAQLYSCLGSVDTRDRNRLQRASIRRADHPDHLATKRQR